MTRGSPVSLERPAPPSRVGRVGLRARVRAAADIARVVCGTASLVALLAGCGGPAGGARVAGNSADAARTPSEPLRTIRIFGMNDLHGHLVPPTGSNGRCLARREDPIASLGTPAEQGALVAVPCGGLAYASSHLTRLRKEVSSHFFVHAGDLTGATPLESALFHDEPPIVAMNRMGLAINAVGNHDFDRGLDELRRFQRGGCAPGEACTNGAFPGAAFSYLSANVTLPSGETLFPSYRIAELGGVKVGFIGMTLQNTPSIVQARNVAGLRFHDEVKTVGRLVPELRAKGAAAIVVVVHQGGTPAPTTAYDGCGIDPENPKDAIARMARELDPAVDVVVSGHTHRAYTCEMHGKLVTSGASYGRVVTVIDLAFDGRDRLVSKKARNVAITHDVAPDPDVTKLVEHYVQEARTRARRPVGRISADLLAHAAPNGESNLGDFIADAMLAATRAPDRGAAELAFMNPGGIRADLRVEGSDRPAGTVTYGEIFQVQPFGNVLHTVTLTGTQLLEALEEQFRGSRTRLLQVSSTLSYTYTRSGPPYVDPASVRIGGAALDPKRAYRVTVSDFIFNGGDGFRAFGKGTDLTVGPSDVEALEGYFASFGAGVVPVTSPHGRRITFARGSPSP